MTKVFLLTADALRYDVLQDDDVPTPNINQLFEQSITYERAFSNGCATIHAFPAILYSSLKHGAGAPDSKSIGHYFQDLGFETIGITSNPFTSQYYSYDKGFDHFKDFVQPTVSKREKSVSFRIIRKILLQIKPAYNFLRKWRTKHNLPYVRANEINETISNYLDHDKDQFIWAHYMEPHAPYSPPKQYGEKHCSKAFKKRGQLANKLYNENVTDEEINLLWQLYTTEIRYLDEQIGDLLKTLNNYEEDTYIIFTSNHGEEFGERGRFQHCQYFDFNIHIPLAFKIPGKESREENKIASHLDILPTILSEFGPTPPSGGINLFEENRDHLRITAQDTEVILTKQWKLIESQFQQPFLFNIQESLSEENNVFNKYPEIVSELKQYQEDIENIDF